MYTSLQRVSNAGTAFLKAINMAICMAEGGQGWLQRKLVTSAFGMAFGRDV